MSHNTGVLIKLKLFAKIHRWHYISNKSLSIDFSLSYCFLFRTGLNVLSSTTEKAVRCLLLNYNKNLKVHYDWLKFHCKKWEQFFEHNAKNRLKILFRFREMCKTKIFLSVMMSMAIFTTN